LTVRGGIIVFEGSCFESDVFSKVVRGSQIWDRYMEVLRKRCRLSFSVFPLLLRRRREDLRPFEGLRTSFREQNIIES
jgi:hypothetical protein